MMNRPKGPRLKQFQRLPSKLPQLLKLHPLRLLLSPLRRHRQKLLRSQLP